MIGYKNKTKLLHVSIIVIKNSCMVYLKLKSVTSLKKGVKLDQAQMGFKSATPLLVTSGYEGLILAKIHLLLLLLFVIFIYRNFYFLFLF